MFAVLYRWKIKAGTEDMFRAAWKEATESIKTRYETGGSRLHRTDDGQFVAYAVWPSRQAWEKARIQPATNSNPANEMNEYIEERFAAITLDVIDDLLGNID